MSKITCFGEVLWDVIITHKKIGGAPLNVASRLQSFNHDVSIISAIGNDAPGIQILEYLNEKHIDTRSIQILEEYPTSEVKITLNAKGSASYEILYPCAWDKIQLTSHAKHAVEASDAFVFGSLASRDVTTKNTLFNLIELATYKIFDLNLRPPFYTSELLIHLMYKADFIKFNDDELYEVSALMGSKYHSLEQNLMFIAKATNTKHICVTKGAHGAVLLYDDTLYYNSGFTIQVIDTVGAGDSFLGSLISQLLNKVHPQKAIDFACAVGALVANSEGANPDLPLETITNFLNPK